MDRNQLLLAALKAHLNREKVHWDMQISTEEWEQVFELCKEHKVLPMVYEAVYECPSFGRTPEQMKKWMNQQAIAQVYGQTVKTQAFRTLYQKWLDAGLTPVVVKGLICRQLYPMPDHRASSDEDILISNEEFQKCHDIMLESGMKLTSREDGREIDLDEVGETAYTDPVSQLHIELHKELFPSDSKAYGRLNDTMKNPFSHVILEQIDGVEYRTFDVSFHLLYLILHAYKHFLHSGFGIRQVCDICMFADAHGSQIDWEWLLANCKGIQAENFTAALFAIGSKYLQFDEKKAAYPKQWKALEIEPEDLLEDLMEGGVFGASNLSRQHSSNITLKAVEADRKGQKKRFLILLAAFPGYHDLKLQYPYLRKYPVFLPIAWIQRLIQYFQELSKSKKKDNHAMSSIRIGSERVELLKKYRIIR